MPPPGPVLLCACLAGIRGLKLPGRTHRSSCERWISKNKTATNQGCFLPVAARSARAPQLAASSPSVPDELGATLILFRWRQFTQVDLDPEWFNVTGNWFRRVRRQIPVQVDLG